MRGLRVLLLIDAVAMVVASTISDPIIGDVALAPTLFVCVLGGVALLSGEMVRPRRRLFVWCAGLTIVAPFPFLVLGHPWGPRAAAVAVAALQLVPLFRGGWRSDPERLGGAPRRIVAALTLSTIVLAVALVAAVWYGATYLVPPPTGVFLRSPYLIRLTTTDAAFAWQLKPGEGPLALNVRAAGSGAPAHVRDGVVSDLLAGTRYVWSAVVGGTAQASGSFTTAPDRPGSPITMVTFGDYGSGSAHEYAVGREAAAVDPAAFLSSGDNAYLLAAPPVLNRAIFTPLRPLLSEAVPIVTLGEHDLAWNDGSAVLSALHLPGHHYVAQYGPVQVVVLGLQSDSSARAYARANLGRGCSPACPVRFVLVHRPIAASDPIMPLLRQRHVAAILAGHLHRYERTVRSGVLEFTVGTGGEGAGSAQFTPATPGAIRSLIAYGFLEIRIDGATVDYQFVNDTGRVLDRYRQRLSGAPGG